MSDTRIEFDTSDLTYSGVHDDPDVFLRRLMLLLSRDISSLTFKTFNNLLRKYHQKGFQKVEAFLDEQLGVFCPHCGQKHPGDLYLE